MDLNSVTIILVEDDLAHATLIERNLRRGGVKNDIIKFDSGKPAVEFLDVDTAERNGKHFLVLLDVNMPGMSGYQVLEHLKANENTKPIPVIMLTTTDDQREIDRCYELGCNAYVTKPVSAEDFAKVIQDLGLFIDILAIPSGG